MPRTTAPPPGHRDLVLGSAVLMVLAQLGFRAWAAYPSFFYSDDYRLVAEAGRGLSLGRLVAPYDAQFMPLGRLVAWLGAAPEHLSWPLLATTLVVMQLLASVACVWMLVTLFGWRWQLLVPLAIYLSSAMTMPAFMWWAAGLNQLPLQAVFFAAVATWVRYLRGRGLRWLVLTLLVLGVGLLWYVKTLLVFPVLAFLALALFGTGGPVRRVVGVVRRYWPAVLAGVAGGVAFLVFYALHVPQLTGGEGPGGAGALAEEMVGTSFASGLFGGPWRWDEVIAPAGQADPPPWTVHLCWVLAALVVAYLFLRRERTLRAWALLAGYVGADYVLLLTTRAQVVGVSTGAEYRYLTDAVPVLVLALGLATMEVLGADQPSRPRGAPLLTRAVGPRLVVVATVLVTVSGLWSSWSYARIWHTDHPGEEYLTTAVESLAGLDEVDLASQSVPTEVMAGFSAPYNHTEVLLPMLTPVTRFPASTDRLHVLDDAGRVVAADVEPATQSQPGPAPGCGWRLTEGTRSIRLESSAIDAEWWLRLNYLASGDSGLRIRAGGADAVVDVQRGLNSVYARVEGAFSTIELSDLDPDVTLCVDTVLVGTPVPAAEMEEDR